jgi:hypothetical protein
MDQIEAGFELEKKIEHYRKTEQSYNIRMNTAKKVLEHYKQRIKEIEKEYEQRFKELDNAISALMDEAKTYDTKTQRKYKGIGGNIIIKNRSTKYKRNDLWIKEFLKQNNMGKYIEKVIEEKEKLLWSDLKKNEDLSKIEGIEKEEVEEKIKVEYLVEDE